MRRLVPGTCDIGVLPRTRSRPAAWQSPRRQTRTEATPMLRFGEMPRPTELRRALIQGGAGGAAIALLVIGAATVVRTQDPAAAAVSAPAPWVDPPARARSGALPRQGASSGSQTLTEARPAAAAPARTAPVLQASY